jgi:2-C-methyl-D-erythritol 4-phosphate cytidylyltransferase
MQDYNEGFTDDATVIEEIGEKINIIDGDYRNIKITRESDFWTIESLLNQ